MRTAVLDKASRRIRWYLKRATGEARWNQYLDRCRSVGAEPMPRRDFERHGVEHQENDPQARCC